MNERITNLKKMVNETMSKIDWIEPRILGASDRKTCECKPGPYTYDSTPSYAIVCSDSSYIKECDDC